ncbi:MAG: M15 family metallopeptidase [Oscillospiraceae bacterium]|nr:M15 family metallopeptidase [Oscillospiraceae bacterium]
MDRKQIISGLRTLCLLLCTLALLLSLAACGKVPEKDPPAAGTEGAAAPAGQEAEPTPEPTPEATPEPTPEPDTPAGRAAAKGLPEPPDVDINSWEFKLANTNNGISEYHIPEFGGIEGQGIDARIMDQAYAFVQGAREAGYHAYVAVAYRNFDFLFMLYQSMIAEYGSAEAVAKVYPGAGVSEHQLGLALDFTDSYGYSAFYQYFDNSGFKNTELYQWLHAHCAEYGFIDRYPPGKEYYYGTPCTEGHFRYVGKTAARYIMENDICFEEFLMLYDPERVFIPDPD